MFAEIGTVSVIIQTFQASFQTSEVFSQDFEMFRQDSEMFSHISLSECFWMYVWTVQPEFSLVSVKVQTNQKKAFVFSWIQTTSYCSDKIQYWFRQIQPRSVEIQKTRFMRDCPGCWNWSDLELHGLHMFEDPFSHDAAHIPWQAFTDTTWLNKGPPLMSQWCETKC